MSTLNPPLPSGASEMAEVQGGAARLSDIEQRLAPYFERTEPRQRVMAYLRGLLSSVERKNSWQLAEVSGDTTPYAFQHLLRRALWDADKVRDELTSYVVQHLGEAHGTLIIVEADFVKKGRHSAGVARQYRPTTGHAENCQIGVFLGYSSRRGEALLDRELYLPKAWTDDAPRRQRAGIPQDRRFATTPQLAQRLLQRALAADVPAQWVTGDSVYGDDWRLRTWLEARPLAYALAMSGTASVRLGSRPRQVHTLVATLPVEGWTRLSTGDGTHGLTWYAWRCLELLAPRAPQWRHWLLVGRSVSDPQKVMTYLVFAPQETALEAMVQVASTWKIRQSGVEAAKRLVGLDDYEVRSWTGWYRHMTLAMWAYAILNVVQPGVLVGHSDNNAAAPSPMPSSLAAFKASRGLGLH